MTRGTTCTFRSESRLVQLVYSRLMHYSVVSWDPNVRCRSRPARSGNPAESGETAGLNRVLENIKMDACKVSNIWN